MTEKRQTWQGYIIRILQHFATKLRNITNFVMLFQAVMKFFLSRLIYFYLFIYLFIVFVTIQKKNYIDEDNYVTGERNRTFVPLETIKISLIRGKVY